MTIIVHTSKMGNKIFTANSFVMTTHFFFFFDNHLSVSPRLGQGAWVSLVRTLGDAL
jgi:hypothetical protein